MITSKLKLDKKVARRVGTERLTAKRPDAETLFLLLEPGASHYY